MCAWDWTGPRCDRNEGLSEHGDGHLSFVRGIFVTSWATVSFVKNLLQYRHAVWQVLFTGVE